MKILDCTLRDGGHAVGFDWSDEFFKDYFQTMIAIGVDTIELGYWGQSGKSDGRFYRLDKDLVLSLTNNVRSIDCSIMVDYHYCSHKLEDYPKRGETPVTMIRVCSRKQDIDNALEFVAQLKEYTGLTVSINAFNISDYADTEWVHLAGRLAQGESDYIYFADTHGSLDIEGCDHLCTLLYHNVGEKKLGFHFHDNCGYAMTNFRQVLPWADSCDTTVMGIGRGSGNLRLEQVKYSIPLLRFIEKHKSVLERSFNPYWRITGQRAVSEGWGGLAEKHGVDLLRFDLFCSQLKGEDRSVLNESKLLEWLA